MSAGADHAETQRRKGVEGKSVNLDRPTYLAICAKGFIDADVDMMASRYWLARLLFDSAKEIDRQAYVIREFKFWLLVECIFVFLYLVHEAIK